jgi:acyl-CoA dehydrogenase
MKNLQQLSEIADNLGKEYFDSVCNKKQFPDDLWNSLGRQKLFGLLVSKENGGDGIELSDFVELVLEFSKQFGTFAYLFIAQNLSAKMFSDFGNEKLRAFLPDLISGRIRINLALTELESGSDAFSIKTKASREGGNFIIAGKKHYVTNARNADLLMVVARTSHHQEKQSSGLTTFVTKKEQYEPSDFMNLEKMGLDFLPIYSLQVNAVNVPGNMILGELDEAWKMLSNTFVLDRILLAAMFIGMGEMALGIAVQYAKERKVFGKVISSHQGIQFPIAESYSFLQAAKSHVRSVSKIWDDGLIKANRDAPWTAYYTSIKSAYDAIDCSLQTLGASGYVSSTVEKLFRDIRYYRIGPISEQIALSNIAEKTLGMRE